MIDIIASEVKRVASVKSDIDKLIRRSDLTYFPLTMTQFLKPMRLIINTLYKKLESSAFIPFQSNNFI